MIQVQNCLFVHDFLNGILPSAFVNTFTKLQNTQSNFTRNAKYGMLKTNSYNSTQFGLKSIYNKCIHSWNDISRKLNTNQNISSNVNPFVPNDLSRMSRYKLKETVSNYFINSYDY